MQDRHPTNALISGLALAVVAVVAMPLSLGCEARDGTTPLDTPDAGSAPFDAAFETDDGGPLDPGLDGAVPAAPAENRDDLGVGCFDFEDTDDDGFSDCDDDDCSVAPICCVGSSSEGCCDTTITTALDFDCPGTGTAALAACAPGATIFGVPAPELRDRTMVPLGGDRFDSGIVLATAVDPRVERLTLEAAISAGESCASCVDAVAFGLTRSAASLGPTTLVDADLALMVSTSQGEVRLIVGGAVTRAMEIAAVRAALGADVGARIDYELTTTPEGLATVRARLGAGGAQTGLFTDVPYAPGGPARVVVWGRSTNRAMGDPPPASIASIDVRAATCDAPASIARRAAPILPDDVDLWWPDDARVESPSIVVYEDAGGVQRSLMAFAFEGRIHLAGGIADGRFRALADPTIAANAAVTGITGSPADAWRAGGVTDPELVRAAGHWEIWLTGVDASGVRSIGRAIGEPGHAMQFPTVSRVLGPDESSDAWDGPSYLEATIGTTAHRYLAARRVHDGQSEIVLHEIGDDEGLSAAASTRFDSAAGEAVTGVVAHRATVTATAFDASEIASPALVHYGGVLRMYYAGRRGTRWAIGMLISEDGRYWRSGNDGSPVLGGSGDGFDALSVSQPEPVLVDGELRLYYAGSDGVASSIGLGSHLVPGGDTP